MSAAIAASLGTATSLVASSVPIVASLVVIDAISGMVKCRKCGFSSKDRMRVERHTRKHNKKGSRKRRSSKKNIGEDMYKNLLG